MPKHLLCADDSATMQKVVAITFGQTEYAVTAVRSVDEALALAKQNRPDLVLADAVLMPPGQATPGQPAKTGYDLCHALKSDPALRNVPVVIMCGNSQPYDEARGKTVGADGHVIKPWDTQALLDKVNELTQRVATQGVALPHSAPAAQARPAAAPAHMAPAHRPTAGMPASPLVSPAAVAHPAQMGGQAPAGAASGGGLPKPPAGLPRPPLIRGVQPGAGSVARPAALGGAAAGGVPSPSGRPGTMSPGTVNPAGFASPGAQPMRPVQPGHASTAPQQAARPAATAAHRSATIMGLPAVQMPPGGAAPTVPMRPQAPGSPITPVAPTARPVAAPSPAAPAGPARPGTLNPTAADAVARLAAQAAGPVAAAVVPAMQAAIAPRGGDPRGVEYEAIAKLSREIIEKIAWEVVPELAETIIRQNLDKLSKGQS
ncbi:MAG: response regulator [Deltaproteobacteria bacterium]|nr:response regulator [Deltaproteobacteria bacterium]